MDTLAGIGPGSWNARTLAEEQEAKARKLSDPTVYRIYTEDIAGVFDVVGRYFAAFTAYLAVGAYAGILEHARIFEIVGTRADLQRVIDCAGDIRIAINQQSVIVMWHAGNMLDVCAPALDAVTHAQTLAQTPAIGGVQ